MTKLNDLLADIQEGLATVLLKKIQSGEITAAELNVARQFLKDNGIDCVPKEGTPVGNLVESLPFTDAEGFVN